MPETRTITTEKDFEHPVHAVWRAMTDLEWLAVWFFPNDIRPEVGHSFTIWSRPIERWDGEFQCKVVEVVPNEKLSFRWKGGHEELKGFGHYMEVVVTWTIAALPDGGTHFHFVQEGIDRPILRRALRHHAQRRRQRDALGLAKRISHLLEHEPSSRPCGAGHACSASRLRF